jgi:hypothetical protein
MSRRARKAVTSNALWLAVLISVLMDYFVWNPEGSDQRTTQDLDNPAPPMAVSSGGDRIFRHE